MPRVSAEYLAVRRADLLAAAARCFAREGFHRTTMQDIAREAAASAGAIYRYFGSKEEVIAAIAAERRREEGSLLRQAAEAEPEVALRELLRAFVGRLAEPEEQAWRRVTVQLWAEALRDATVMDVVRQGLAGPMQAVAAIVARAQREGKVAPEADPRAVARLAAAVFQGLVLQQAWEPDVDVDAYLRAAELLLEGLLPGRDRDTPKAPSRSRKPAQPRPR
jgi:AcrR family transcriptional regulator